MIGSRYLYGGVVSIGAHRAASLEALTDLKNQDPKEPPVEEIAQKQRAGATNAGPVSVLSQDDLRTELTSTECPLAHPG